MSIKRVSDLPQVTKSKMDIECFKNSFFEISYLSDMQNEYVKYESSKIKAWDLVSATVDVALFNPVLSGNVYINPWLSAENPERYTIDMRASNVRIYSSSPTLVNKLSSTSAYVDNLFINKDYQVSNINQYNGHYGVNIDLLQAYVDYRLRNFNTGSTVPLLSFIFSDHRLDDEDWKIAGSQVNLKDYSLLSAKITNPDGTLKQEYRQKAKTTEILDTWFYEKDGDLLKLPHASCFIMATDTNATDVGDFYNAKAPNITGKVQGKTVAQDEREPFTYSDTMAWADNSALQMTKRIVKTAGYGLIAQYNGAAFNGMTFDASKSSSVYSNSAKTITPDHVKMYVYFYVGQKNRTQE